MRTLRVFSHDTVLRRLMLGLLYFFGFLVAVALIVLWHARPFERWRGPVTDHFNGDSFHHSWDAPPGQSSAAASRWRETRVAPVWKPREITPMTIEADRSQDLKVTYVTHATVLIQVNNVNILTDPVYSKTVGVNAFGYTLGVDRVHEPGIRFEDLPEIDVVFISHSHYDHMDLPTLRMLARRDDPLVVVPLGNRKRVKRQGFSEVQEIDWWDHVTVQDVRLTAVPAQHWTMRTLFDRNRTLWAGLHVKGANGSALFAGDTGYGPHFAMIAERLGGVDIAAVPIGAYLPRWFMAPSHAGPADMPYMHTDAQAKKSFAIHFATFPLGDDKQGEPESDFREASQHWPDDTQRRMIIPVPGQVITVDDE